MIALPLETWVSIGTLLGGGLTLFLAMKSEISGLRGEMGGLRAELREELGGLRAELREEMAALEHRLTARVDAAEDRLTSRITHLDDRVYALASGLRHVNEEEPSTQT